MTTVLRRVLYACAPVTFLLATAGSAHAQATRTWVSGVGNDANPCSRTAPCKTYAGAISHTAKDGEISTLDPGGYGCVTITKSITINGGGGGQGYGSLLGALTTNCIIINITDPADVRKSVRLDGLNLNGASTGTNGINFIAGNTLHIENTVIDGFTGVGVNVNVPAVQTTFLSMNNVTIRNAAAAGVRLSATSTGQTAFAFNRVNITKNGIGIDALNGSRGSVRDSIFGLNTTGIALTGGASSTLVNVDGSTFTGSLTAINAGAGTIARIARNFITQNADTFLGTGAVNSGGNNTIIGNTNNNPPNGGTTNPEN